jgi:quinol monooxygenase YgiN
MIIRVLRITVREDRLEDFKRHMNEVALPRVKSQAGLVSINVGLPRPDAPCTFCFVMTWDSIASLKEFAGEDWEKPLIMEEDEYMIVSREIEHYDTIGLMT